MSNNLHHLLKQIPSVDEIIVELQLSKINIPHDLIVNTIRQSLKDIRKSITENNVSDNIHKFTLSEVRNNVEIVAQIGLRKVINGTGIVLHTNLGRTPISKSVIDTAMSKLSCYSNLEVDILSGKRGERTSHIEHLINSLTSSQSSMVVNNNASAVLLMLNTIAEGKEVIISRGQQVEIGGSFRIPDVINKSGCQMVEVGTTNKTHFSDYENAITKDTGAILVAHTSNYKVVGFTQEVELLELSKLAKRKRIPLLVDLGSGAIADFNHYGLPNEESVKWYLKSGADLVSFSGDKLLGGPQSGIICGKKLLVKKTQKNALYRALRCDKFTFAILEEILRTYRTSKDVSENNLTIHLLTRNRAKLLKLGRNILKTLPSKIIEKYGITLVDSEVEAGSGSLPTEKIESVSLIFSSTYEKPSNTAKKFRLATVPVLGYIHGNRFRIDLKAIPNEQIADLSKIMIEVLA
ncbi:MAG: L-seryl-tRNA(Sec) selenium transferase [Candidatus Marinimicrobia bacterium]|nr:L-seryl-tRNA(Sec) selenium transferase [Candidatus Neomarinimicrobiota bacterium]MBL7023262.1 L-seryl-tRNA(Sec) selenium transferase [Candidatus Neomarinimicrobiota bacterium]MBL7108856.1 L-seryl-tRNA(Sec) selenium transferase [Candidatus Neomarinimicrobiota bacterium]